MPSDSPDQRRITKRYRLTHSPRDGAMVTCELLSFGPCLKQCIDASRVVLKACRRRQFLTAVAEVKLGFRSTRKGRMLKLTSDGD